MHLTPFLVVLLGVITLCICNNPITYSNRIGPRQRQIRPRNYLQARKVEHFYPLNYDQGNRNDRSQVVLTARGMVAPVFLPRHQDGSLNFNVIPQYVEFLVSNGVAGALILGNNGEGPALNMEDRRKVIDAWVSEGKRLGLHIMVQVGAVPYPMVIETTKYAQAAGVDSILTLPEVFYKPDTVEELVEFIDDVGEAAPNLPVLYYDIPNTTDVFFEPPDIQQIARARVPNFRGIKYNTNDLSRVTATLNLMGHGHVLFLAADRLMGPAALIGVRSVLSGTVNFWPQLVSEIFDAVECGDVERAHKLQETLTLGYEAILAAGNKVSALKATMEIVTGIKMGPPGRPLPLVTQPAWDSLERQLKALGLVYRP